MIKYAKMSLFDAPKNSFIVHACNSEGVWGAGIAKEFAIQCPSQYVIYKKQASRIGEAVFEIFHDHDAEPHHVVNLITCSIEKYMSTSEEEILINTATALFDFLTFYVEHYPKKPIYSNRFNSGIFNVPWEKTEKVLKQLTDRYNVEWTVCDYESK